MVERRVSKMISFRICWFEFGGIFQFSLLYRSNCGFLHPHTTLHPFIYQTHTQNLSLSLSPLNI
ncbi:hypothetical protein ACJIZ3_008356 [Penstemon smallii]|uniref:Uncharacterized protein n=1 Tax=Penstemon smallii TaxID=265156 RepID=A0ABD3TAR3_9LAMI